MSDPIRTMLRGEYQFEFTSTALAAAAGVKVAHHRERLTYWDGQHKELREKYIASVRKAAETATEKEAKEAEEMAAAISYMDEDDFDLANNRLSKASFASAPGGVPRRREIVGDPEIYQELQKALGKVTEHRNHVESFARWEKLFKRTTRDKWPVTYSDAEYFGL